jgi:hypothetical protein
VKKIVGPLLIVLLVFIIWTRPSAAADSVQNIWATLRTGAESIGTFITDLI